MAEGHEPPPYLDFELDPSSASKRPCGSHRHRPSCHLWRHAVALVRPQGDIP